MTPPPTLHGTLKTVLLRSRLETPDLPRELARGRRQPQAWQKRRLIMVAADHPARGTLAASGDPWAMGHRVDLLWRLAEVLSQPGVDGILATPDVVEDLLVLNDWGGRQGGVDFLTDKVIVGSMNRSGLEGAVFELDDRITAYTAKTMGTMRLDGGKLLLRLDPHNPAGVLTLQAVARAVAQLDRWNLPAFIEPISVPLDTAHMIRLIGVATGLGPSSIQRWLKLPWVEDGDFRRLLDATTCPVLLLGGANPGGPEDLSTRTAQAMAAGEQVRGVMMGRGILYPADGASPIDAVRRLVAVVKEREEEMVAWLPPAFTP